MKFRGAPLVECGPKCSVCCCFCRGTVTIYAGDNTDPSCAINTWGTKELYLELRKIYSKNRGVGVVMDPTPE